MCWVKYLQRKCKNFFLVAPALAIKITWKERLAAYGFDFILIESINDMPKINPGQIVLISYDRVANLQPFIKKFVKNCSYKIALLTDESDELTKAHSQRNRAMLNCFRKV